MTPEPYTPLPGGRYLIQPGGQRVRLDDVTGLPPAEPVPAPAPVTAPAAAPKPTTKE